MAAERALPNLWHATAPAAPETTTLAGDIVADVAIVGGGFTGLSAALHLADKGLKAVVIEARMIGFGGSGRNVGLVNAGMWTKPDDLIATLGKSIGERLLTELGDGPSLVYSLVEKHGMDCEAVRNGTLHLAVGEDGVKEVAERQAQWKKFGAPVEVLDAEQTRRLTGAKGFTGALLDRRAGTIQPMAYARGLARAALAAGAHIYTSTPLESAERKGDAWKLNVPGGSVTARNVILATNAYGTLIGKTPWTAHTEELTILPYFQFATNPLPDHVAAKILPERQGCWDTGLVMTSFRTDKQNRMIFGSIGRLDAMAQGTHRAFAKRSVRKIFPEIGDFSFEYWWDGRIGMTTNNLPQTHQLAPNVYSVSGYNGRGIAPGTVFGRALAHRVMGEEHAIPIAETPVTPDPWRTPKSAFYHVGAQAKHLVDHRF
ncbi:glycine/D-amino acid oxidase-like deaminating enzyme [Pararhizobium capsulatum DSM 1112]|uniref:Glycine/D-amino acid oxidase-like deaminating enzyme n=1 Tax=Pararhizobium capsulatum DSM 1112 TaxID=1121113 RepID=A0ABU0BVV5_9HYPH|nr:FAD-binding oxidoreductase [Pararhizobium capsulatum]MDQ0320977.1 glycine/D-amino acid oxidase-like deaminating enzyme [Pararhizobium capsulatum DSM 1112]